MRRALGKGLAQLIGEQAEAAPSEVAVESIRPNANQPRNSFDDEALQELAASIREVGILQPIIVRPLAEGTYELIAGERRWRAAQLAGLATVPVIVRSAGRQDSLEWALIENIQREDIAPLECARAYRRLVDEFGLTQEAVADKVGKSRVAVTNTLRLLRLPKRIQDGLAEGQISEAHARAILGAGSEPAQLALYDKILKHGLTAKDAESGARTTMAKPRKGKKAALRDPDMIRLEEALSERLGTTVRIKPSGSGGEITVPYYSDEDLDRLVEELGVRL
jgi:ParB family transcriptional regulator, chromosome partitioning protein